MRYSFGLIGLTLSVLAFAAPVHAAEDWGVLSFLIGDWVNAASNGAPGQASAGEFSLQPDVQGNVLVRKNFAEYAASGDKPAIRHDDLMVIFHDPAAKN